MERLALVPSVSRLRATALHLLGAMKWLQRYLGEKEPTLKVFAKVARSLEARRQFDSREAPRSSEWEHSNTATV